MRQIQIEGHSKNNWPGLFKCINVKKDRAKLKIFPDQRRLKEYSS